MSIAPNTIRDLRKITAQFEFLLTVSDVRIEEISRDQMACSICHELFEKALWKKTGDSINSPVKLDCGHIFGIQCLAHLVFTSDFANKCPLCRAQVIPESYDKEISYRGWQTTAPLLHLLVLVDRPLASSIKEKSLDFLQKMLGVEKLPPLPGKHMERTMVLYEDFLNQFCDSPAPAEDRGRLQAAEEELQHLRHLVSIHGELNVLYERLEARSASLAEIRNLSESNLKKSEQILKDARCTLEKLTGMFFLYGMVAALALLGLCGQLPGSPGALYDLPSRIFVRLWFIACIVAVAQSRPSGMTLTVLGMVVLAILFE